MSGVWPRSGADLWGVRAQPVVCEGQEVVSYTTCGVWALWAEISI